MEEWLRITLVLCTFGLLREIRPSEPYVSEFILGPWRNITSEELNQYVYPVGTYSYLSQLVLIFLITDFLRFKPVIILSGFCGVAVYAILLWTTTLQWLQASQFVYGLYMATEVAYFTYIFAKVAPAQFPRASSLTRASALAGRSLSGISSQLLVSLHLMDYRQLIYITFMAQILATFWAFWLPPVNYSIYFHRQDNYSATLESDVNSNNAGPTLIHKKGNQGKLRDAVRLITGQARSAYSRVGVNVWSLLYAISLCLFYQAQYYVQLLWMEIRPDMDTAYNGAVEAILTLLGGVGAYSASVYSHGALPGLLAGCQGVSVIIAASTNNIYVSYSGYVIMGMLFHYIITYASTKIANEVKDESCYGLVFGINTLLGTALQSLLTFVIISENALMLPIRQQFYVVGGGFLLLSLTWIIGWVLSQLIKIKTIKSSSTGKIEESTSL